MGFVIAKSAGACCLVGMILATAIPASGDVTVSVQPEGAAMEIAPASWLAPYSLTAASSDGETLRAVTLKFANVKPDEIKDIAVFSNRNGFSESLLHHPEDWTQQDCKLDWKPDGTVIATLAKPLAISATLHAEKDLLVAFRSAKTLSAAKFTVQLLRLQFSNESCDNPGDPIECRVDATPPQAKIMATPVQLAKGVRGVRIRVRPNEKLAFPPQITVKYGKDQELHDHHTWPVRRYSTPMRPSSDGGYEYTTLFLSRLSGNLEPEKTVAYTCSPAPDPYRFWKDNTGHDLLDGDARNDHIASPGGMLWLHTERVELVFDLKASYPVGEAVVYALDTPERICISGSEDGKSWRRLGDLPGQARPRCQYGPPHSMYRAAAVFPELPKLRYLKIDISCRGSLYVTEVAIYGVKSGAKELRPESFAVYLCDRAGNVTEIGKKLGELIR